MSALALKFRGPLIAIFVLLLSAGLALAGGGLTFPDAGSEGPTDGSAPAVAEGEDSDQWDNHGDLVSDAAQMETPDGFKNHGAFVSCVAKMRYGKKGSEAPADFVLAELTPEDCERAAEDEAAADEAEADDPADEHEDQWKNHGDLVSDAAQMETPDGFRNHGAFVSCVAKMRYGKKGSEAPADFVLAELAPEDCTKAEEDSASADEDSDTGHGKGKNKGKGKGHGRGR